MTDNYARKGRGRNTHKFLSRPPGVLPRTGSLRGGVRVGYAYQVIGKKDTVCLAPATRAGRRRFLAAAAGLCGTAAAVAAAPALAARGATRCVSFVHTHTGERLRAAYFRDDCYQAQCLAQVDYLLRDFRTGDVHTIDRALLDILFDLQTLADRDAPFEVISGYRSPATNAMLHRSSDGVAQHSMHLEGRAIDVRLSGYPTDRLAAHARSLSRGGVGFYARSDFVHVDTGRVRVW
jgi:uncharacterized protein YcbK (DUF882 family)